MSAPQAKKRFSRLSKFFRLSVEGSNTAFPLRPARLLAVAFTTAFLFPPAFAQKTPSLEPSTPPPAGETADTQGPKQAQKSKSPSLEGPRKEQKKTSLEDPPIGAKSAPPPPKSLQELFQRVQADHGKQSLQLRQREAVFLKRRNKQKALLNQALKELKREEDILAKLQETFERQDQDLSALEERLALATGALGELFGTVRQTARETSALLEDSIISAQYPGRAEELKKIAGQKQLPDIADLEKLWLLLLTEMAEQGRISIFQTELLQAGGNLTQREIIRAGSFNLFSKGRYLIYEGKTGQVREPGRQPERAFLALARKMEKSGRKHILRLGLDPSRGSLLSLLIQSPSLGERLAQGGLIGYIILLLLLGGLALSLHKHLQLKKEERGFQAQAQSKEILPNNPLGEIMRLFAGFQNQSRENFELKAEELILKKTNDLRRGLSLIRLIAGVAPLLGLLGTVTGMIATFQSITLFGTGDPKLMAGGISQALVTTALGLISAIPLIFAHSFVAGRAKKLADSYEEQALGLTAEKYEKGK